MTNKITIIKPPEGAKRIDVNELWQYRELAWMMTLRDIKVRYKQTVLGVAWAVIQPLTAMLIFTFIFGRLAQIPSDGFPYPVFVFSGLLAWNFFSSAVAAGGMSTLAAASLISKVYFPRLIIPLSSIGVSVIDFLVALVLLVIIMAVYAITPSWQIVFFPLFFIGLAVTAIGISTWLAAITVVYRDFRFVIPFMLQIWMYITPVIYPVSFIPQEWRWLTYLNPVMAWVAGLRASILGTPIDWYGIGISAVMSVLILLVGIHYFEKSERRFADVI